VATGFGLPEGVDNGAVATAHVLVIPPPAKALKKSIQIIGLVELKLKKLKLPTKNPLLGQKLGG
jgi:hypothetical protein